MNKPMIYFSTKYWHFLSYLVLLFFFFVHLSACNTSSDRTETAQDSVATEKERIHVVEKKPEDRVDIFIDQRFFASYIYPRSIKKPVLYPIHSPSGIKITRGFPLDPKPRERIDHPHHVGMWLNHGDVNDLDFWNNSDSVPSNRQMGYGTIFHRSVRRTKSGNDMGFLEVTAEWKRFDGRTILDENTKYYFSGDTTYRIIDRITKLTASDINVIFKDSKEGMMAIRVIRELEQPADGPVTVLNENMEPVRVSADESTLPGGQYINSEGQRGDEVWGKRARWVKLASPYKGSPLGIVIMDHPENPNHPSHWHARGYGLFAVNPFGSQVFTNGRDTFNFFLPQEESLILKYRIMIYEGEEPDHVDLNNFYDQFVSEYTSDQ